MNTQTIRDHITVWTHTLCLLSILEDCPVAVEGRGDRTQQDEERRQEGWAVIVQDPRLEVPDVLHGQASLGRVGGIDVAQALHGVWLIAVYPLR